MATLLDALGTNPHALGVPLCAPAERVDEKALTAVRQFALSVAPDVELELKRGDFGGVDMTADFDTAHAMLAENRGLAPYGCWGVPKRDAHYESARLFVRAQQELARSLLAHQ